MKHTEPIPPELAAACSKCGAQPMLTGNDGEQSFRCHCSGCARKLIVPHWTTEGAIDAWNDAQKDEPAEPCPYCGGPEHGAVTAPTPTCTRHLWDVIGAIRVERGVLRWAIDAIAALPAAPAVRRIIAAANESTTVDAVIEKREVTQ